MDEKVRLRRLMQVRVIYRGPAGFTATDTPEAHRGCVLGLKDSYVA